MLLDSADARLSQVSCSARRGAAGVDRQVAKVATTLGQTQVWCKERADKAVKALLKLAALPAQAARLPFRVVRSATAVVCQAMTRPPRRRETRVARAEAKPVHATATTLATPGSFACRMSASVLVVAALQR